MNAPYITENMCVDAGCRHARRAAPPRRTVAIAESQTPAAQALQSIGPLAFGPDGVAVRRRSPGGHDLRARPRRQGDRRRAGGQGRDRHRSADRGDARHGRQGGRRSPISPSTRRRTTPTSRSCAARAPTPSRRCFASTATARSSRRARRPEADEGRRCRTRRPPLPPGAAQPADGIDHRHGVRRRQAGRRRAVERGVRVEAALGAVSVRDGRRRHERRDLPRQPRPVRDALAGRSRSCPTRSTTAAPHRRLHLHAAGEVPGLEPQAGAKVMGTTIAELGNRNRPDST